MNRSRLILIAGAILAVAVVALGYVVGASPLLSQAAVADESRAAVESQNQVEQTKLDILKEHFAKLDEYEASLSTLGKLIPQDRALDAFYGEVASCLTASGEVALVFTTGEAGLVQADESAELPPTAGAFIANFFAVPVTVTGTATADQVLTLASCLRSTQRLFFVSSVSFSPGLGSTAVVVEEVEPPRRGAEPAAPTAATGDFSINGFVYIVSEPVVQAAEPAAPAAEEPNPTETPAG